MKKAEAKYINKLLAEYEEQLELQKKYASNDESGIAQFRGQVALLKRIKAELNV